MNAARSSRGRIGLIVGWLVAQFVAGVCLADDSAVVWRPERPGSRVTEEHLAARENRALSANRSLPENLALPVNRAATYCVELPPRGTTRAPVGYDSLIVPAAADRHAPELNRADGEWHLPQELGSDALDANSESMWDSNLDSTPWNESLVTPPLTLDEYPLDRMPLEADLLPEREESQPMAPSRDGRDRAPFSTRFTWLPGERFENAPGAISIRSEQMDVAFPVRIRPEGIWLALAGVRHWELNTSAQLPDSGLPVPSQLWNIELGTMHLRNWSNGWKGGGLLMVGSPSDQPFAAWRDMTVAALGFVTIPAGPRDAWNLSLFYSPTGQIIFPIPGVAYIWRPNRQLQMQIGIPFSLEYRPNEFWTLTANYQPLTNAQIMLRRSWGGPWSVYGGYRTTNETFLLADRELTRERTYVFDQRLMLGVQRRIGAHWQVDLAAAYVFDRTLFQAEKFSGPRRDELDIEPGLGGMLQISWTR